MRQPAPFRLAVPKPGLHSRGGWLYFAASIAAAREGSTLRKNTMATANDLRRGMAISYNGDIVVVLDSQHRTPGNLRAFVQATLRSIRTGRSSDVRFSSTERIE